MKQEPSERLSDHLLRTDQQTIDDIWEIDNAEKLKQYVNSKKKKNALFLYCFA